MFTDLPYTTLTWSPGLVQSRPLCSSWLCVPSGAGTLALGAGWGPGWCGLCLSASPYSCISFPQKPERKGGWMCLYATVFTREHPALALCGLGCGQGMHTDPLTWKHSWGHQNRCSLSVPILTISASAVVQHGVHVPQSDITPCVSHTLTGPSTAHPKPVLIVWPFYQTWCLKHLLKMIASLAVSKSNWITSFPEQGQYIIFDLLIQYCVLLNSHQITGFSFKLLCFPILIPDCNFFL